MNYGTYRGFWICLLSILFFSCKQDDVIGKWKPIVTRHTNTMQWEIPTTIDLENTDSLRTTLLADRLKDESPNNRDSSAILLEIDSLIRYYQSSSLTLKKDASFIMISSGFIFPNVIPGWHFGDTLMGKWSRHKDSLALEIGEGDREFSIMYKIEKINTDTLVLRELLYATEAQPSREMIFRRQ